MRAIIRWSEAVSGAASPGQSLASVVGDLETLPQWKHT
jgi:hypothetical protein